MKRIGLFLLAVVMVAGLAGCSNKDHDADPVGTWFMSIDYGGCNGSPGNVVWHIHNNGTFVSSSGSHGIWSIAKNTITMNFSSGTIYTGEVDGDSMAGTMNAHDGDSGCWTATRTSKTP